MTPHTVTSVAAPGREAGDSTPIGTVYLVGAGPGDPDLITVRGRDLLARADVVLHDRLIPHELLAHCRTDAHVIDVGKVPYGDSTPQEETNALLIAHARAGRTVVRLKGGDPFVFGRGGEEVAACRAADVPCVIVPGVSSAFAVPAVVGIPVTHRHTSRTFAVIAGRTGDGRAIPDYDYAALARIDTLCLLMGRGNLRGVADALMAAGRAGDTPAAAIANGTRPDQRTVVATLATIAETADAAELQPPVLTVIGPTAAFASASGEVKSAFAAAAAAPDESQQLTVDRSRTS